MLVRIHTVLNPGGCIVFNSVSESSRCQFDEGVAEISMNSKHIYTITVDNNNPITIMKAL